MSKSESHKYDKHEEDSDTFLLIVVAFSVIAKATQSQEAVQKASSDVSQINAIIDKHHC